MCIDFEEWCKVRYVIVVNIKFDCFVVTGSLFVIVFFLETTSAICEDETEYNVLCPRRSGFGV